MLDFKDVKGLIKRAEVAFSRYIQFEETYNGKVKGTIYKGKKKYFFNTLTTYNNNLKNYSKGSWAHWGGTLNYNKTVEGKKIVYEKTFVILLPSKLTKTEIELLIPFKVEKGIEDLVITDLHYTGESIISGEIYFTSNKDS